MSVALRTEAEFQYQSIQILFQIYVFSDILLAFLKAKTSMF